jgi:hypothetical protein
LKKKDVDELRTLGRAFGAIAFVLWGVFPMHVLGWLVSAVGRHPDAEAAINKEPVYKFILLWQGGVNAIAPLLLLILFLVVLLGLSYMLKKSGHATADDGMANARPILQKFLLPAFLSASAFACGVLSGGSLRGLLGSTLLLLIFGIFAGLVHYFTDTTKD